VSPVRVPPYVSGIQPYVPGKPVEEVERELGLKDSIKLASNENPLGPSPRAVEAVCGATLDVNRYPDGGGFYLRRRLAELTGVPPEQVVLGNGSTELVELLARAFLGHDDAAVMADQAFIMYRLAVTAVNGNAKLVPLSGMKHDLAAMAAAVTSNVRLVYIANPNNPTGTYVGRDALETLFNAIPPDVVVVLDEAYREYIQEPGYPDGVEDLTRGRNIVVLRTFSKIHGLAGLRIGYALTTREIAVNLEKVRSPFNTSSIAQAGAMAALQDLEHVRRSRDENRKEQEFLQEEMRRRGWRFTPSVTNFHLVDTGRDSGSAYGALLQRGVITRPMAAYNFPTSLRVSIGIRAENERFLEALGEYLTSPAR
jgi:histidinol-phosphate aminotransferase